MQWSSAFTVTVVSSSLLSHLPQPSASVHFAADPVILPQAVEQSNFGGQDLIVWDLEQQLLALIKAKNI